MYFYFSYTHFYSILIIHNRTYKGDFKSSKGLITIREENKIKEHTFWKNKLYIDVFYVAYTSDP